MIPNRFEYFRPANLEAALSLLSKYQDEAKVLAGGQSLISVLKLRLANPSYIIDLGRIGGLNYIREGTGDKKDTIAIGALTTYAQIKESKLLQTKCPLLPQTASVVGDVQVRNRGTLGGSIAHADPAGDMPAAILALGADLKAIGPNGERWIPAEDFFLGLYETALAPDEILTEIRVPMLNGGKSAYLKAARRPSDFAIAGVGVCVRADQDRNCAEISVALTGITDKAYRAAEAERLLKGNRLDSNSIDAAAETLTREVDVIANMHASSEFRAHLARVYFRRAMEAALSS